MRKIDNLWVQPNEMQMVCVVPNKEKPMCENWERNLKIKELSVRGTLGMDPIPITIYV